MHYGLILVAGALFCNCLPHLTSGLTGAPFPTPFAKPHGVGNSPPLTNFLWGAANLLAAILIAARLFASIETAPGMAALVIGFLCAGVFCSLHFGKVRAARLQGLPSPLISPENAD